MATAARTHGTVERIALDGSFSSKRRDDGDGRETAEHIAAIDEIMATAEHEESWPRFINVLRARGSELRERMLGLVATVGSSRERPARSLCLPLLDRLAQAGVGEESLELVDHAQRMMARARGLWYLLEEEETGHVRSLPEVCEHACEGEKATWMYTFALVLLGRAALDATAVARPSTELAVTLAVESSRDACAHWATALELLTPDPAA
jgi:hypothetical protein